MLLRAAITVLILVAAGLIGWRTLAPQSTTGSAHQAATTTPAGSDYYMRDATIYQMSDTGERAYRLHIAQMLHYPNDATQLHDIDGRYETDATSRWLLQAQRGYIPRHSRDIFLTGGVVLQHPKPNGSTVVVHTSHAWVRTQKNIIETNAHATAVSPVRTVETDGLRITLNNDHMKLLNNVQVRYTP